MIGVDHLLDIALILLIILNMVLVLLNAKEGLSRYLYFINRIEGIEQDIFDLDDEIDELKRRSS